MKDASRRRVCGHTAKCTLQGFSGQPGTAGKAARSHGTPWEGHSTHRSRGLGLGSKGEASFLQKREQRGKDLEHLQVTDAHVPHPTPCRRVGVTRAAQEKGLLDTLRPLAAARAQPSPWLPTRWGQAQATVICPRRNYCSCWLLFPTPSSLFNKRAESRDQGPGSWALGNGRSPIPTGTHSAATLFPGPWFQGPPFSLL